MTEQEWSKEISDMLHSVMMVNQLRAGSDRKLRLLGCAFCREVWTQLSPIGRRVVEIAEGVADGLIDVRTRITYEQRASGVTGQCHPSLIPAYMAAKVISECGWYAAELTVGCGLVSPTREQRLIRDVFGNPYRSVLINSEWFTWHDDAIRRMAQTVYDERSFELMPILADTLEEAGCTDQDILNHCRGEAPHVKGCWVVDLLLGKK